MIQFLKSFGAMPTSGLALQQVSFGLFDSRHHEILIVQYELL